MTFRNRADAGKKLAAELKSHSFDQPVVIALPRGGVPIGVPIAEALQAPLDVLVVRKIGSPQNEEYGIGAVTEDGPFWLDQAALEGLAVTEDQLQNILNREIGEVISRVKRYRGKRPLISVEDRDVILVDDGLATGVTAKVGAQYLREAGAKRVILAVPTCARSSANDLREIVDQVVCLNEADRFFSVGQWYDDFSQVTDEEVTALLSQVTSRPKSVSRSPWAGLGISQEMEIREGNLHLKGHFNVPSNCIGIVIFAHGSGSSRMSPRNIDVANRLHQRGLGTLLFDLLTETESKDRSHVFDISFLADRLKLATAWVKRQKISKGKPLGYFGASTGAAAALWAAADSSQGISAICSRGGRPDLAFPRTSEVTAPTLLIVGGNDPAVLDLNEQALKLLQDGTLKIIPNATHLFEEEGALEKVAELTGNWFHKYFEKTKPQAKAG